MHLHDRIDTLGAIAEEALEEIPTEVDYEDFSDDWTKELERYEQCLDYIDSIRNELEYGRIVEL
jgi:hypothetical protein